VVQPSSSPIIDPGNLGELKKSLAAEIRKNNVLLGTTLEKSGSWRYEGGVLKACVSTKMEYDLLRRFSGIIAELLAQRFGATQRVEFELTEGSGGWAGLEQGRPSQDKPTAFSDSGSAPARPGSPDASRLPAAEPDLSLREKEALGLVERYFKGSVTGYSKPQVPGQAQASPRAERTDLQTQD
jgi:hypothetical protein